jgi:hypothetical protein
MSDFKYQLLATGALFFGLFFIEYPPIFLLGYWSWSGAIHKTLSGIIIVLNLFITQYMVRRWGFFRQAPKVDSGKAQEEVPQVGPGPEESK